MPVASEEPTAADATPLKIAALRQYLALHPGDDEAIAQLAILLPPNEAVALAGDVVKSRPKDPESYRLRGTILAGSGRSQDALADFETAATLDSSNAQRYYTVAVMTYEIVAKPPSLDPAAKRAMIDRGLAALDRADALRPDYFEALTYRTLLLRQLAETETDPAAKQKWIDQADALRARIVEIHRKKSAQ
jgi:tetratricopeptide (TPR) repeat protein